MLNEFRIVNEHFLKKNLTLHLGGFFSRPKFVLDGETLDKNRKCLNDDFEISRKLRMSKNPFDSYPWIEIDGIKFHPLGEIAFYDQLVVYTPLCLMAVGGAIGGAFGGFGSFVNSGIMREYREKPVFKYFLCTLSIVSVYLIWALSSYMIRSYFLNDT